MSSSSNTNDVVVEGFDLPQIVQYLSKSFDLVKTNAILKENPRQWIGRQ
jgi:hypothetical protein